MIRRIVRKIRHYLGRGLRYVMPSLTEKISSRYSPANGISNAEYIKICNELIGMGDDPILVRDELLKLERSEQNLSRIEVILYLMDRHPRPHIVNYMLCKEEFKARATVVRSFPTHLWLDISSICTVECRFCKYTHQELPKKLVSLEQVKAIEWLKYVRMLNLTAGTAEAISHPRFIDIFSFLRDTYPHLHISLLTNGRTLDKKILTALRGRLDALHVSMNASNEADYNRMIKKGSWQDFDQNMQDMHVIMKDAERPKISASFIVSARNQNSTVANLEYAAKHGASVVLFHHYYPKYVNDIHFGRDTLADKLLETESLYFNRELSDKIFELVRKRGVELGVDVHTPPPFSGGQKVYINWGVRSLRPPVDECTDPWMNMYMLWGFKSKKEEITICCGMAQDIGVYFDHDQIATKEGLLRVWNDPIVQAYRRSANGENLNPVCAECRKVDRFDPATVYLDQSVFYEYAGLPVPEHWQNQQLKKTIPLTSINS